MAMSDEEKASAMRSTRLTAEAELAQVERDMLDASRFARNQSFMTLPAGERASDWESINLANEFIRSATHRRTMWWLWELQRTGKEIRLMLSSDYTVGMVSSAISDYVPYHARMMSIHAQMATAYPSLKWHDIIQRERELLVIVLDICLPGTLDVNPGAYSYLYETGFNATTPQSLFESNFTHLFSVGLFKAFPSDQRIPIAAAFALAVRRLVPFRGDGSRKKHGTQNALTSAAVVFYAAINSTQDANAMINELHRRNASIEYLNAVAVVVCFKGLYGIDELREFYKSVAWCGKFSYRHSSLNPCDGECEFMAFRICDPRLNNMLRPALYEYRPTEDGTDRLFLPAFASINTASQHVKFNGASERIPVWDVARVKLLVESGLFDWTHPVRLGYGDSSDARDFIPVSERWPVYTSPCIAHFVTNHTTDVRLLEALLRSGVPVPLFDGAEMPIQHVGFSYSDDPEDTGRLMARFMMMSEAVTAQRWRPAAGQLSLFGSCHAKAPSAYRRTITGFIAEITVRHKDASDAQRLLRRVFTHESISWMRDECAREVRVHINAMIDAVQEERRDHDEVFNRANSDAYNERMEQAVASGIFFTEPSPPLIFTAMRDQEADEMRAREIELGLRENDKFFSAISAEYVEVPAIRKARGPLGDALRILDISDAVADYIGRDRDAVDPSTGLRTTVLAPVRRPHDSVTHHTDPVDAAREPPIPVVPVAALSGERPVNILQVRSNMVRDRGSTAAASAAPAAASAARTVYRSQNGPRSLHKGGPSAPSTGMATRDLFWQFRSSASSAEDEYLTDEDDNDEDLQAVLEQSTSDSRIGVFAGNPSRSSSSHITNQAAMGLVDEHKSDEEKDEEDDD